MSSAADTEMEHLSKPSREPTPGTEAGRKHYLPLAIDMAGLRCLVVGGGRVGTRKALTLARSGAKVTVLSLQISDRLREAVNEGLVSWQEGPYDPEFLGCFALVVAATSEPARNIRIGHDCESRGILSCVVSPGRFARVIFPAVHRQDGITIAVHSDGRDCARSRKVRDELAAWLELRDSAQPQLVVFGARRTALPVGVFESLTRACAGLGPGDMPGRQILILSTCERWECYFVAPTAGPVVRDIMRLVCERSSLLLESYRPSFYTKRMQAALHHLLRVVSGLDSPLRGETEVVGQVRSSLQHWLHAGCCRLRDVFQWALAAQKRVRADSRLNPVGKSWAHATVSLLEGLIPPLGARRILLAGCGRLGEAVALRLLERGAEVLPFSRRLHTSAVSWCSRLGLSVRSLESLWRFVPGSDALVLSADGLEFRDRTPCGRLVVVDLTGGHHEKFGGVRYFSLDDVGNVPMSGAEVARIANAERIALQHALISYRKASHAAAPMQDVRLGGRASALSLVQIQEAVEMLRVLWPQVRFSTVTVDTPGDRDKVTLLSQVEEDDFFTRDLDVALMEGSIDVAVHSAKDLPARIPDGLAVVRGF